MPPVPSRRLQPALADAAPPPSAERAAFDLLHRRIDTQRALLAEWQAAIDAYEQRYARELVPLLTQYRGLHVALLERLDHAASGGLRLGRTDAQALHALIVDIADSLLPGEDDAAQRAHLQRLRERYAPPAEEVSARPDMDAGAAADDTDPEAVLHRLEAEAARAEAERARRRAAHRREAAARKKQRGPEAVEASQSLRAVYRQLVSTLHPDRESDPAERQRKTALMQRVNEAYAAQRLTDLLALQQEAAALDMRHADRLPEARLAAYTRLLGEQLAALQRQVRELEADFKARHRLNPHGRLKPATLGEHLRIEQAKLTNGLRELQREQRRLDDPDFFKQWVRAQRKMAAQAAPQDDEG